MALFRGASVKVKLILASVLGSGTALLVVGAVITSYDLMALRTRLVRRMSVQADIVGTNCLSALLFSDPKSAETTLGALKADPRILAAGLYTSERRQFATYLRDPLAGTRLMEDSLGGADEGYRLQDDRLVLWRSVLFDGKPIGTVVIESDLLEVTATMTRDVVIFASVLLASLLLALAISSRLQRDIAQPILRLGRRRRRDRGARHRLQRDARGDTAAAGGAPGRARRPRAARGGAHRPAAGRERRARGLLLLRLA